MRLRGTATIGLAFSLSMPWQARAISTNGFVVRVYDDARVAPRDMDVARASADTILEHAHLHADWVLCASTPDFPAPPHRPACRAPLQLPEVIVRIVHQSPDTADGGREPIALGYAYVDTREASGVLATVCAGCVDRMARRSGADFGVVLGRAMAHEIGHLLLGTTEHERRGLMRPAWTTAELRRRRPDDWWFSCAEASSMQGAVARRTARPDQARASR